MNESTKNILLYGSIHTNCDHVPVFLSVPGIMNNVGLWVTAVSPSARNNYLFGKHLTLGIRLQFLKLIKLCLN